MSFDAPCIIKTASHPKKKPLAAAMDHWLLFSFSGSRKLAIAEKVATAQAGAYPTSNASSILGRHHVTTHPSQTSTYGSVHSHLAGDVHVSVLPALKAGNPEEQIWNFDYPAAAKMFDTVTGAFGLNGMTMYQSRRSGTSIDVLRYLSTLPRRRR